MNQPFSVKCPYCKNVVVMIHDTSKRDDVQISNCDDEFGGCGQLFAVESRIEIARTVYELKEATEAQPA